MRGLKNDLVIVFIAILAYSGTAFLKQTSDVLFESKPRVVPPKFLKNATFGFRVVIANFLWLRLLQNDDFCETGKPKANFNSATLLEDVLKAKMAPSRCNKGWVYQMLDLMTDLNPQFKWAYRSGGLMLSIGVDDREGARLIFEKGIREDYEDWQLLYRAAYHYIFEVQNAKRAAELLSVASLIPNVPAIIPILAARLERADGRLQLAIETLTEYLKTTKVGTEGYNHALFRLNEVKAEAAKMDAEKK